MFIVPSILVDEPGFERIRSSVFPDLGLGLACSGRTGSKFGLFEGVRKGSKFGFGGQTWVRVSSKFDQLSSKLVIFGFKPTLFYTDILI